LNILGLISSEGFYGAENALVLLCRAVEQAGCRYVVGVFQDARAAHMEVAEQARARGLAVEEIPCDGRVDWRVTRHIRRVTDRNDIHILHTHGYKADLYGFASVRKTGKALVATCHGQIRNGLILRTYAALDRAVLRRFDRVATVSDELTTILVSSGVKPYKVTTISNGIDLERFGRARSALREELGDTDSKLVGMVARLDPGKGAEVLLRAGPLVLSEFPGTRFVLIGGGPERTKLEALAASLGITRNVVFTGVRNDMPEVYASLDVVALPSRNEGMPMCLLEAMAAARPVVATAVGSIPKLVLPEQTGLLIAPDDPVDLARKIMQVLRQPEQARAMAENGRLHVARQYSAAAMAGNYIRLYEEALRCGSGARRGRVQVEASHRANVEQMDRGNAHEPRHILFLIDQLNLHGGAERALLKMTRLLDPDRYRATVVVLNEPADRSCLSRFPCPVEVLGLSCSYDWSALKAAWKLRRIIREQNVSLVQTFFESSDLWGAPIAKLSGCPLLISSRRDMGFRRRPLHHVAYRLFCPLFNCVHAVSEPVRDYTIRHDRTDPRKVITIPNGVDLQQLSPKPQIADFKASYDLEDASHLIVDATTIRRVKGIDVMMRTAAIVCREFPRAVFLVAGSVLEEDFFAELKRLAATLRLDRNFRFLGGMDDVFPLLSSCHVFCHLSRSDGMSNAVLEAMACGIPCVVSRCGGNPGVVGEGGFVVKIEDAGTAADRILYLLRDVGAARRTGERARQIVREKFSAEAMMREFIKLYDELHDSGRPRRSDTSSASNAQRLTRSPSRNF
jgi:glycosyltransferase involved in cell wall biosynthesis